MGDKYALLVCTVLIFGIIGATTDLRKINPLKMDLKTLDIFVKVAELGSFTRAADHLGLTKTRVSAAVVQLERDIGTRLLQRTTRSVRLSPDGEALLERARSLLLDAEELRTFFQSTPSALSGRIRLDLPVRLARNVIIPRLPEFIAAHPRVQLELSTTDRFVDLIHDGIDIALRVGTLADSTLVARRLGVIPIVNCASPAYLAARGTPQTLAQLDQHVLVHYLQKLGTKPDRFEYRLDGAAHAQPMHAALTVNNSDAYLAACLAGLGIIQMPLFGVHDVLKSGALVTLLPEFTPEPMPVSLITTHSRHLAKRVRALMEWLETIVCAHLDASFDDYAG
jgi:DNA-binding transcriptional LysR family regulator